MNGINAAERKRAILISTVGGPTYQLIRNHLAPTEKTYDKIVQVVLNHHQPPPSDIVQRLNFHSRYRREGENTSTELRKLSTHCDFGDTLNERLRDQFVWGINNQRVQRSFLAVPDLTFGKALGVAQNAETVELNAKQFGYGGPVVQFSSADFRLCFSSFVHRFLFVLRPSIFVFRP